MKFIKTLPYKLKRTLPILGIAGASLLAGCNKDDEPTPPGLHDTVYTWTVSDLSRISPPIDICMSADSANVNRVILQNTDGNAEAVSLTWLRELMEDRILSEVTLQNQHKVRGRGEIRGFRIDDRSRETYVKHVEDSLWLVRFGFVFKDPLWLSDFAVVSKQKQR